MANDSFGAILVSTNPTAGAAAWQRYDDVDPDVDGNGSNGGPAVACPSTSLCVAVDYHSGKILSSTNPAGGAAAWQASSVGPADSLNAVACASNSLCVAVGFDPAFGVATAVDPAGGAAAWSTSTLDPISARTLSCPASDLCVGGGFAAQDDESNVAMTTDPLGGGGTWTGVNTNPDFIGDNETTAVSCASRELCVLGDLMGNVFIGTPNKDAGGDDSGGSGSGGGGGGSGGDAGGGSQSGGGTQNGGSTTPKLKPKPKKPVLKCRKGFKKKKVGRKVKCVKTKKKRRR